MYHSKASRSAEPGLFRYSLLVTLATLLFWQPVWAAGPPAPRVQSGSRPTANVSNDRSPAIRILITPEKYAKELLPEWAEPAEGSRNADWIVEIGGFSLSVLTNVGLYVGLSGILYVINAWHSDDKPSLIAGGLFAILLELGVFSWGGNIYSVMLTNTHTALQKKVKIRGWSPSDNTFKNIFQKKIRALAGDKRPPALEIKQDTDRSGTSPVAHLEVNANDDVGISNISMFFSDWVFTSTVETRGVTTYPASRFIPLVVGQNEIAVTAMDLYGRTTVEKISVFRTQGNPVETGLSVTPVRDGVMLHSAPNESSKSVQQVSKEEHFFLTDYVKGWYEVELPDQSRAWLGIKDGVVEGRVTNRPIPTSEPVEYPPLLSIESYSFEDESGDGFLDAGEGGQLTFRVRNEGKGPARAFNLDITPDRRGVRIGSEHLPREVPAGSVVDVSYRLIAEADVTSGSLAISAYASDNQAGSNSKEEIARVMLRARYSDIDLNPPQSRRKNPDGVAVIIGNRDYTQGQVYPVKFAIRDAETVKSYLTASMGFSDENIIYLENATLSQMQSVFGSQQYSSGKLHNLVYPNRSDVFVYYSGHGAPGSGTKESFLLPVDVAFTDAEKNGINISFLRQTLAELNARSVTLVVDACFSGLGAEGSLLGDVSGPQIVVKDPLLVFDKGASFFASKGDQVAYWYPLEKHGLFTYYFLQGLRGGADSNNDRSVTMSELGTYLESEIPFISRRLDHDPVQQPVITISNQLKSRELVKY